MKFSLAEIKASPRLVAFFFVCALFAGSAGVYIFGTVEMRNIMIFLYSSLVVMTYYYIETWIKIEDRPSLIDYLVLDNPAGTYNAVKRLLLLCFGAGVMGHMDTMTMYEVMSAGAGIGYLAFSRG